MLSCRETYCEKLRAALTRREPAIRDFYDIDHGVRSGRLNTDDRRVIDLVRSKLAVPGNDPIDMSEAKHELPEEAGTRPTSPCPSRSRLRRFRSGAGIRDRGPTRRIATIAARQAASLKPPTLGRRSGCDFTPGRGERLHVDRDQHWAEPAAIAQADWLPTNVGHSVIMPVEPCPTVPTERVLIAYRSTLEPSGAVRSVGHPMRRGSVGAAAVGRKPLDQRPHGVPRIDFGPARSDVQRHDAVGFPSARDGSGEQSCHVCQATVSHGVVSARSLSEKCQLREM